MHVHIEKDNTTLAIKFQGTLAQLFLQLDINPETVLAAKNSTIIDLDEPLKDTDTIRVISVISGG